ncbi:MAG TPA: hypothetical protein VJ323_10975, partial [Bryobacteraceae bacterium]|nr:hypothetical protein [Bryobacteraceae bacterium]
WTIKQRRGNPRHLIVRSGSLRPVCRGFLPVSGNSGTLTAGVTAMRMLLISALISLLPLSAFAQRRGWGYRSSPFTPAVVGPAGIPTSVVPGTALYGLPGTTVPPGTAFYGLPALTRPHTPVGYGFGHGRRGGFGAVPIYGAVGLPYYGWDNTGAPSYAPPPPDSSTQVLANEVDKLTQQVQQLREQRQAQSMQPPAFQPEAPIPEAETAPPEPSTILVLRDGKKIETDNYAVMGPTFWNFSAHPVQRIPISQIDVSASRQANQIRGIEFPALGRSAAE